MGSVFGVTSPPEEGYDLVCPAAKLDCPYAGRPSDAALGAETGGLKTSFGGASRKAKLSKPLNELLGAIVGGVDVVGLRGVVFSNEAGS